MKKTTFLSVLLIIISVCMTNAQDIDSTINSILKEYISTSNSHEAGILVGIIDNTSEVSKIYSSGMISKENDLRLVCPASKPVISYIILNKGIDINATIDKWFPVENGYTNSNLITVKMLLSNTSGIVDYVGLLEKELIYTPMQTIETVYKNHELAFIPGDSILYSNTNFNIAGLILEKETGESISNLLNEYFKEIAPSIRMDDGHGNYPNGYPSWPYHFSQSGFAGGLIGTANDYLKTMSFISNQTEFAEMTNWVKEYNGIKYGLGLFGQENVVMYHGNSGANISFLLKINSKIIYFHTTNEKDFRRIQVYIEKLIPALMQC